MSGAWWATFYAEPVLPMAQNADQRPTDLRNSDNTDLRLLSLMALHHSRLSHYGLESLITNHLRRMPIEARVKHVRELGDLLFQWFVACQNEPPGVTRVDVTFATGGTTFPSKLLGRHLPMPPPCIRATLSPTACTPRTSLSFIGLTLSKLAEDQA